MIFLTVWNVINQLTKNTGKSMNKSMNEDYKIMYEAIEILYKLSQTIKKMECVKDCTVESDNNGGEIIFTIQKGKTQKVFILKLKEFND